MATAASGLVICLTGRPVLRLEHTGSIVSKNCAAETKRAEAEAALASLYEDYYDRVVRYIFVRVGNQTEAEDLAGEVFLRALRSLWSFEGQREQMQAWLFKIAHNIVVDHFRKRSKQKVVPIDAMEVPDRLNLEEAVENKLQMERLSEALKQLTPAQREVIGLRFFAGLSSAEVGEVLGKNSGAVRQMQHAGLETLRKLMRGEVR